MVSFKAEMQEQLWVLYSQEEEGMIKVVVEVVVGGGDRVDTGKQIWVLDWRFPWSP